MHPRVHHGAIPWRAGLLAAASACCHASPPSAPQPPPPLASAGPGARCVDDPFSHAVATLVEQHGDLIAERTGRAVTLADYPQPGSMCTSVGSLPDLDGDGVEETEILEECTWGTASALHLLYLSAGGCPQFAGELVASELVPVGSEHAGVRDLETTVSNGCAGNDFVWTRYGWTGAAYEVIDTATCELCPEGPPAGPDANAHPHCRRSPPPGDDG